MNRCFICGTPTRDAYPNAAVVGACCSAPPDNTVLRQVFPWTPEVTWNPNVHLTTQDLRTAWSYMEELYGMLGRNARVRGNIPTVPFWNTRRLPTIRWTSTSARLRCYFDGLRKRPVN